MQQPRPGLLAWSGDPAPRSRRDPAVVAAFAAVAAVLSVAGFVHAFVTPKSKGFAVPEPAADKEAITA